MYIDPSGHDAIIVGMIIGTIIGAAVGGVLAYNIASQNNKDGWELFGWTMLGIFGGAAIGAVIGAGLGYMWGATLPITYTATSFMQGAGGTLIGVTSTVTKLIPLGKIIVVTSTGVLATGITIMFSKHRPEMTNKPPFSWTTQEEGISAMENYSGNANKAADEIMNNHFDSWKEGAGQDRNVIKKWLDRVIRALINLK